MAPVTRTLMDTSAGKKPDVAGDTAGWVEALPTHQRARRADMAHKSMAEIAAAANRPASRTPVDDEHPVHPAADASATTKNRATLASGDKPPVKPFGPPKTPVERAPTTKTPAKKDPEPSTPDKKDPPSKSPPMQTAPL